MKKIYDALLQNFEEWHRLDVYSSVREMEKPSDGNAYASSILGAQNAVISAFEAAGKQGIEYLLEELNSDSIIARERATHILGEVASRGEIALKIIVAESLENRKKIEPEGCVYRRLEYELVRLEKPSKEDSDEEIDVLLKEIFD